MNVVNIQVPLWQHTTVMAFKTLLRQNHYKSTTAKSYINTLKRYLRNITPQQPNQLTETDVLEYIRSLPVKKNTKDFVLNVLRLYHREILNQTDFLR